MLLDSGCSKPIRLWALGTPAIQLQVRGQRQGANTSLRLQGRQQEVTLLHSDRATSQPTCPGPLPGLVPQGPVPEVSSWLALLDRRPPSPELGWGRGHLGQVGGRGLCLLKVEFGRKNWPCSSSSHAWPSLFSYPRTEPPGRGFYLLSRAVQAQTKPRGCQRS